MTDFRWSVKLSEEKSAPPLKWTSEMCSPYLFLLLPFLWPSRSLCLTDSFRGSNLRVSIWDKYWVGQKVHWVFFCKIKDTVFILTNNIIDLGILSISAISRMAECWLFSINVSVWSLSTWTSLPNCGASSSEKSPARNFANHTWHFWSITAPSPQAAQIFFAFQFCISVFQKAFTFLEIIKHNMPKCCLFSSIFNI